MGGERLHLFRHAREARSSTHTRSLAASGAGLLVAVLAAGQAAAAPSRYRIDQRYGAIEFSVGSLGLFTTEGRFARFAGDLLLDPQNPAKTRVDVVIDLGSVEMPLANEVAMLRSATYFDTARYPQARFDSVRVQGLSPGHFRLSGTLQMRGVSKPMDLDAVVTDRHYDQARKLEVADFDVTGRLHRSSFGMRDDQIMVSDVVKLHIHIHITVPAAPKTG